MTTMDGFSHRNNDISFGFFGWFILNNVVFVFAWFLLFRFSSFEAIAKALWLLNIVAILTLLGTKRFWICMGGFLALMINVLIWLGTPHWAVTLSDLWFTILPFPLGYFLS
jgi:hypothetical protein